MILPSVVIPLAIVGLTASQTLGDISLATQKLNWLADEFAERQLSNGQLPPAWDPNPRGFVHGFIAIEMYKAYQATGNAAHKTAADNYFTYYMDSIGDASTRTPANHGIMMYSWSRYKDHNPQSTGYDQLMDDVYGYMQMYRWDEGSYFRNGYNSTCGMDAANTCDLASMGAGLLNYHQRTGNASAYQDAEALAQYFVTECVPYTYQGAWSSPIGSWVVAPTGNTTFEHHPAGTTLAYQLGWGFGAQEAADYLMPLYHATSDATLKQKIQEKCVASMKWQFDACQFEDGALGLFGRDDKWMGMTAAAVQTFLWNYDAGFLTQNEIQQYGPKVWAAASWMLNNLNSDCLDRAGYYQVSGPEDIDHRSNGYWGISWAMEPLIRCDELAAICGVSPPTVPSLNLVETEAVNPIPAANNLHGCSVALDGDYLAVASNYQLDDVHPGTVEIYLRNPDGSLTHRQTLAGFSGTEDFGVDVSLSGDTLAVGAFNSNATYIYTRDGSNWSPQQTLTGGYQFGTTVSVSGDNLMVGEFRNNKVSLFHREEGTWSLETEIVKPGTRLGYGVGLCGDLGIAGSWGENNYTGSISMFRRVWDEETEQYVWNEDGTYQASDAAENTWFGYRSDVHVDEVFGDVAIVSAKMDDEAGADAGAAYIFRYDSDTQTWIEQTKLLPDDLLGGDTFGSDVAIYGNTAIVGSRYDDDGGTDAGSAYIFQWDGSTYDAGKEVWLLVDKLTASDGAAGEMFGEAVAVDGDRFAVGAWGYSSSGAGNLIGSAYLYTPSEEALAGDLNGDGFVGGDDLDIVRGFWGQNVTAGDLLSGDPSGDGFVGGDDLDMIRANWGQGSPPAPTPVPEPSLIVFLLAGAGTMWPAFRRRRISGSVFSGTACREKTSVIHLG